MLKTFIPFLVPTEALEDYFFGVWPIPQLSSQPGHHCGKSIAHLFSQSSWRQPPVSIRAKAASREGLHSVAIEKSAGPFGAPWDIVDLCVVPASMTHFSDTSLESHQEHSRASQIVSDAAVWVTESKPKTQVLSTANKYTLILKWWPNLESDLWNKSIMFLDFHVTSTLKSWLLLNFSLVWGRGVGAIFQNNWWGLV